MFSSVYVKKLARLKYFYCQADIFRSWCKMIVVLSEELILGF